MADISSVTLLFFQAVFDASIAFVVSILGTGLYNVYLHPLSKFPGPPLRAAFHFPDNWSKLRGYGRADIKALHDKYGPVVRIVPNGLSFNTPQAWKDIYGFKSDRSELSKCPRFYKQHDAVHILIADQAEHARLRRMLAPAFTERALMEQEPILTYYLDLLVVKLKQRAGKRPVDLMACFNFLTFDIIGDLCLGEAFGALDAEEYHTYIRDLFESIKLMGVLRFVINYPALGVIFKLLVKLKPSITQRRVKSHALSEGKLKRRLELDVDRKDFLAYILRDSGGLSYREVLANTRIMLTAGSETTATHLTGAAYLLMSHPDAYARAKAEVRSAFKSPSEFTLSAVSTPERLPYLNAVVRETLRFYPSVPSTLPRITGFGGNVVNGIHVPANTTVGVHHWSAYRNPHSFAAPDEFIPERWLPEVGKKFAEDQQEALQPFHVGPRSCLGKNLAHFEIRATLVRLLWHFELKLEEGGEHWLEGQKEFGLWDKPSLWTRLELREAEVEG